MDGTLRDSATNRGSRYNKVFAELIDNLRGEAGSRQIVVNMRRDGSPGSKSAKASPLQRLQKLAT